MTKYKNTELVIKASVLEDGLIEQVHSLIDRNEHLFEGEKVVLMADAHKTTNDKKSNSVPVGFTMTLSKGLIPVDFISADMFCGVSAILIKDFVPTQGKLKGLSMIARDIIQVNRRLVGDEGEERFIDFGTLGGGNHYVEVGVHDGDTLISVHSGSRAFGGKIFKRHKNIAIEHNKKRRKLRIEKMLNEVEPKERQNFLKNLPKESNLPLLDVNEYPEFFYDLKKVELYASMNRQFILKNVALYLIPENQDYEYIETVHNFLDTSGEVPIVRKGSISAKVGEQVVIPINMKDGVILGKATNTGEVNESLPHGAGRILSRSKANDTLSLEDFKKDMVDVISPSVSIETLDESPRAYKSLETILNDIDPYLEDYRVFKTVFNFKGV